MNVRYSTEEFCSICYDSYEESSGHDAVRLNCQHAFGRKCIIQWALESNICPVCGLETFPAEVRESACVFRRLADRPIFGLDHEQKFYMAFGFFFALFLGSLIAFHHKFHPDTPIGNGVETLLFSAVGTAGCTAFFRGRDHWSITFRLHLFGAAIGLGFSFLIALIANTFAAYSRTAS